MLGTNKTILNTIRLPSEKALLSRLLKHPTVGDMENHRPLQQNQRFRLEQECMVIETEQISYLQERIDQIFARLGIRLHTSIAILPDRSYNAFVFVNEFDDALVMGVNAGLLEDFSIGELLFVLGHETAHFLYQHTLTGQALQGVAKSFHANHPFHLQIASLFRRQEISCDRLGLLCCGELDHALTGFMKMMTQSKCTNLNLGKMLSGEKKKETEFHFFDSKFDGYQPWLLSHPSLQIREMAIRSFHSGVSESWDSLVGKDGLKKRMGINKKCDRLLDSMELDGFKQDQEMVKRFYRYAVALGKLIAMADGTADQKETTVILQLQELTGVEPGEKKEPVPKEKMFEFFKTKVSPGRRLRVLDFLISVAIQDLEIVPEENLMLKKICSSMGLPGTIYEKRIVYMKERLEKLT